MTNFQRTRSKVWWGDSQPLSSPLTPGSPLPPVSPLPSNKRDDGDWEPQLPHWVAHHEQAAPVRNNSVDNTVQNNAQAKWNNSVDNVVQNNAQVNPWPLRHGSPGSHKSQDSGFSDSDSSPPSSQCCPSPENKSSSSSDSNNNENITVKAIHSNDTPANSGKEIVDSPRVTENALTPNPMPRNRSSSFIQTPYDLQMYYQIHNDEEHMKLLKDPQDDLKKSKESSQIYPSPRNIYKEQNKEKPTKISAKVNARTATKIEIKITPSTNSNDKKNTPNESAIEHTKYISSKHINIISPSKKYPVKKSFVSSSESITKVNSKVARVKDLDTSKNKSDDSLEYIKLSDNNEIAVNNQPRVRTPIANVSYVPTERISSDKKEYRRSLSNEENFPISITPTFQRNRLNRSLNFEAQKLDQQILDIQDGYHSLVHIDEDAIPEQSHYQNVEILKPTTAILGKHIMDSLQLKPMKKLGPRAKQRLASKVDKKELFRLFPPKKERTIVETRAGGILSGSHVPSLGLPRTCERNSWVEVGYPERELLIPHCNERLVATDCDYNIKASDHQEQDLLKKRSLLPPPQFQDKKTLEQTNKNLTHDSKREKFKDDDMNFTDVRINLACTSTPKMLAPHEFMNGAKGRKNARRTNLFEDFETPSRLILNEQNEILYRERSIDQTALERACDRKPEPVQYWLCDLAGACENECLTTLQSKPLGAEMKALVTSSSATITGNIRKVQTHGQIIVHQYSDVIRQIESGSSSEDQICLLVANINEFVLTHSITLNTRPPGESPERWDKIKVSLQTYLQRLIDIGEDVKIELNESVTDWSAVLKHLHKLVDIFTETTKAVFVQQMKTLVSIIEEPPSDLILKSTLTSMGHLAMLSEDPPRDMHETCASLITSVIELPFVACGVPRALLAAIIESNKSSVKALALRALATVCVTGEAVKQFEEGGGFEILADLVSERCNPEPQLREAVTVLTQVTAPWLRGHYDLTQLRTHLHTFVQHITDLLSRTECCQLLLLCTACLVNLVRELELENKDQTTKAGIAEKADQSTKTDIVEVFTKYHTVERLLDAVKRRGPSISVFLQEQTASLLASLSRVSRCVLLLSRSSAVSVALVCFARAPTAHAPHRHELRAHARLHAHAAEGIDRLSVVPEFAHQIVQLEGVPHLTKLVRSQRTRAHFETDPDRTLIHCLKALRTIYRHHPDAFEDEDVDQIIRPHLMESIMLFSAKHESYV